MNLIIFDLDGVLIDTKDTHYTDTKDTNYIKKGTQDTNVSFHSLLPNMSHFRIRQAVDHMSLAS